MTRQATAVAVLLIASLAPASALAHQGPGYLWDPVVTHTNGMRIASTTSLRSHSAYWQCQQGRHGYCDGQMHGPCRDGLRTIGTRCHGQFVPPYTPQGPTSSRTHHAMDGLETADAETLGHVAPRQPAGALGAPAAARAAGVPFAGVLPEIGPDAAPQDEETWVDALQTIGSKIAQ